MCVCKKCGSTILDDSKFCSNCGDTFYEHIPVINLEWLWVFKGMRMLAVVLVISAIISIFINQVITAVNKDMAHASFEPIMIFVMGAGYIIGNFWIVHKAGRKMTYEPAVSSLLVTLLLAFISGEEIASVNGWQPFFFLSIFSTKIANKYTNFKDR